MNDIEVLNNENEKMPEDIADERSIVFEDALEAVLFAAQTEIKYEGYLNRQRKEVERQRKLEDFNNGKG